MESILEHALVKLNQIDHYSDYLEYLQKEWYFTVDVLALGKFELHNILNGSASQILSIT